MSRSGALLLLGLSLALSGCGSVFDVLGRNRQANEEAYAAALAAAPTADPECAAYLVELLRKGSISQDQFEAEFVGCTPPMTANAICRNAAYEALCARKITRVDYEARA